jgi:hypothetical protein
MNSAINYLCFLFKSLSKLIKGILTQDLLFTVSMYQSVTAPEKNWLKYSKYSFSIYFMFK